MGALSVLKGIYASANADVRTSLPRNYIPVVKETGLSKGYLKPADGIVQTKTAPGIGRGGINWNGTLYRVLGTKLCAVGSDGSVNVLGDVGGSGPVTMTYSFDRLGIASSGALYYWSSTLGLIRVTDPNLGYVADVHWMAGYFVTTDGSNIVVTNLTNPTTVNPLKYGSSESDPDPIKAVDELRNELYALNRYTVEVYDNVGGDFFPFQTIQGAIVPKGVVGTYAYCSIGDTFVFCGSGRGESPGVYLLVPGDTVKLSTREIDLILASYSEDQLSKSVMECVVRDNQQQVRLHLPDRCIVYDTIGSKAAQESIWFTLDSGLLTPSTYRARNLVWAYNQWNCEDPTSAVLGKLDDTIGTHYGSDIGWEFGTPMIYNEGNDAIVLELELVTLPGRVPLGAAPVVWTTHSTDGETWAPERSTSAGMQGERARRIAWRNCGRLRGNYRMQKFRGTSAAHLPVIRLEMKADPLMTRPGQ